MPMLSIDYEQCYRREIVILTNEERVQLEKDLGFFSEYRLILYENGLLVRMHRYGEWSEGLRPGWENTDELEGRLAALTRILDALQVSRCIQ